MSKERFQMNMERKKKNRKRLMKWIFIPILLVAISASAYVAFLYNKAQNVMEKSYQPVERETRKETNPKLENVSILFLGVDDSETRGTGAGSRTDALMVATFNEKQKSIKLLSIPRDSYVYIPEEDVYTKINHAHAYGGVELTIQTVEELLEIPIDYYVKMNFEAFIDVIDALGGIEVEVPYTFTEQNSKDQADAITLHEGLQHLDGEEALALARTRRLDSDIERGKRQQEILKAILKKSVSVTSLPNYGNVIEAIGDNMTTDLRFDEMTSFLDYLAAGKNLSTETLTLPGGDSYIGRVYYYQLDEAGLEEVKLTLKTHLETDSTSKTHAESDSSSL